MKRVFVQCSTLLLEPDADPAAPGGAVTLALCGSWDHTGPCRWPHHTSAGWNEREGRVRVVFVAEEADRDHVRALISQALASGMCVGPDGRVSRWETTEHHAGTMTDDEVALGRSWGAV
ncbi:MAG: hypothetical protein EOP84_11455 [Verrucomicrobiaceae bacterium]|nr:MAG: hypothetical protein EOP84_11455 [Verrucomicrobiaceae bacterium]